MDAPLPIERIIADARAHETDDRAVIATDIAGAIVYWNDRAEALYGWKADEAIGRNVLDVIPTRNTADEGATIMEELRRGRPWSGSFIVQHRNGTPMLAHVTDIPVREGGKVVGVVGLSKRDPRLTPAKGLSAEGAQPRP
jgi:PAS domain S-box-containing protein